MNQRYQQCIEKNIAKWGACVFDAFHLQVGSLEDITSWNGNLSRTLRMVLNCITPCGRTADWKKAHANAIFILHKVNVAHSTKFKNIRLNFLTIFCTKKPLYSFAFF
jgi:hypothetical protein